MADADKLLTIQLLAWIAARPRGYAETLDAWRTQCPRLAVWEEAKAEGLVDCAPGSDGSVTLTQKGLALLAASSR
jgi:hypothetical protein